MKIVRSCKTCVHEKRDPSRHPCNEGILRVQYHATCNHWKPSFRYLLHMIRTKLKGKR